MSVDWKDINVAKLLSDAQANIVWTQEVIDRWKTIKTEYKRNKEIDEKFLKDFLEGCSQHIQVMTNIRQMWEQSVKNWSEVSKRLENEANGIPATKHYVRGDIFTGEMENGKIVKRSKMYMTDLYLTEEQMKSGDYEIPDNGKWIEL